MQRFLAAALALVALAMVALAGCDAGGAAPPADPTSQDPDPAPTRTARAELAARAAAAQDLVAVSFYALRPPGAGEDRTVRVVRAADGGWRVDIGGGALGGTADISIAQTGDGLFQCGPAQGPDQGPDQGADPGADQEAEGRSQSVAGVQCVRVDELAAAVDPRVQHVFTDWPGVLADRSAALSVSDAAPPDGVSGGDCFGVQPSAASLLAPLDAGTYCYQVDGTLTGAALGLGTLRLTGSSKPAPPAVDLPGPVVTGEPLPTASPTPSPASLVG